MNKKQKIIYAVGLLLFSYYSVIVVSSSAYAQVYGDELQHYNPPIDAGSSQNFSGKNLISGNQQLNLLGEGCESELQEYDTTTYDSEDSVDTDQWKGQSFTAFSSYTLKAVKFYAYKANSPDDITMCLKDTDINGYPTGDCLTTGTLDTDELSGTPQWVTIDLTPYDLAQGTLYAFVFQPASAWPNSVRVLSNTNSGFTSGKFLMSANKTSWTAYPTEDLVFETWGCVDESPSPTPSPEGTGTEATGTEALIEIGQIQIILLAFLLAFSIVLILLTFFARRS